MSYPLRKDPRFSGPPRSRLVVRRARRAFALAAAAAALGAVSSSADRVRGGLVLAEAIRIEAIPLIVDGNYLGLGSEAGRLQSWMRDHPWPLTLRKRESLLEDATLGRLAVSAPMVRTLERLNQWYGLVATAGNPITHEQLEAGSLSPASVDRIRRIFEKAIRRGVSVGGGWLTPEGGGEATIDRELRLVEVPDPRWEMVQDLARLARDPATVASYFDSRSASIAEVDTHGLLKVAVARLRLGAPGAEDEVRRAILTLAQNAAPTYVHEPDAQFASIVANDWRGRYVGKWHTHAPHYAGGRWVGGDVPSFEDMQNAVQLGQYLTLAFQPDGFDLYDAQPLADASRVDLGLLRVIRYRSRNWRSHFEKLLPEAHKKR